MRLMLIIQLLLWLMISNVKAQGNLPKVVVLATGGTIAGAGNLATDSATYQAAKVPIESLLENLPQAKKIANLQGEQVLQIASEDLINENLILLGRRISKLLKDPAIDGVVITHGTDTLEETAYFLHLTVHTEKPIVMVAAMRPGTSISSDGPLNLYDAIAVAGSWSARGRGVLVVMNDHIHSARDVSKMINVSPNAFVSPWGALGMIVENKPYWFRRVDKRHTTQSEFNIDSITQLPMVDIAYGYSDVGDAALKAFLAKGDKAIVFAGTGSGSIPKRLVPALREARQGGVQIIRSSHVNLGGIVVRSAEQPDDQYAWVAAHDLNPQKAKILVALALTKTLSDQEIQRIFWEY